MTVTRTKIVATLGPAADPPGALEKMIAEGVDVLRVNLSHGPPSSAVERVKRARKAKPDIAILADLCGPKLRLGELPKPIDLHEGSTITLGEGGLPVADPDFARRVRVNDPVYIADGMIRLEARRVLPGAVECRVQVGGIASSHKGVNLPLDTSDMPCLTGKDRKDLEEIGVIEPDFVALSYVRRPEDIGQLRRYTAKPVIAKIEKQQAVDRMEMIVAVADAVMVARGDLGVEIPIERVPAVQKRLIRMANAAAKPVITATQMLVSMVTNAMPTRAEVTDVANAVLDGTDAVMLSEETAVGHDPAGVVRIMEKILRETEPLLAPHPDMPGLSDPTCALARAAVHLAHDLKAAAILVPTISGSSAIRVSMFRPEVPILAFSPRAETTRRLALAWGITPHTVTDYGRDVDIVQMTVAEARRHLPSGSRIVLIGGWPPGVAGNTSFVHETIL